MWKHLRQRIRYYIQFVPVTLNAVLFAAVMWIVYHYLFAGSKAPGPGDISGQNDDAPMTSLRPFILLMTKLAFALVLLLVAISVLSALAAWAYYLYLKKKRGAALQLEFSTDARKGRGNRIFLNAALAGAFRPLLGFVKGRLFYDDYRLTDKFPLLSDKRERGKLMRFAIGGKSRLALPDIREYQLRGGFVFFEDMLRLFSFAVPQGGGGTFYQPPTLQDEANADVSPKKTEQTDIRIEQMRRVQGEHLAYKDFESGDDVRRIVWKVYAKNRDLVVRIPEMFEPYASHLYFYASFHTAVGDTWLTGNYGAEMLNYYKNAVWTVYDALAAKEFAMRYIPDQPATVPEGLPERDRVGRIISSSDWQQDKSLSAYFNTRQGTALCISSLSDVRELAALLDEADSSTMIYFVKLSRTFRHLVAWNWFKRLLFLPPKDRLGRLRGRWTFSPLRAQIRRREREIESLLRKASATSQTL